MSNHTINEDAFQAAYKAYVSVKVFQLKDELLRGEAKTEAEAMEAAEQTVLRIFLKEYETFKG